VRRIPMLAAGLAGLLAFAPEVSAYDCDGLVIRMRQAVPAVQAEAPLESAGVLRVNMKHPAASQLSVMCVEDYAALHIDWVRSATPSEAYWQLGSELGAIVAASRRCARGREGLPGASACFCP